MENTTITLPRNRGACESSASLQVHELAHQWSAIKTVATFDDV
jgi:hypothetical protein